MPKRETLSDFKSRIVSDAVRRLNPDIFGPALDRLDTSQHGKPARALVSKAPAQRRSRPRTQTGPEICIRLVAYLVRRMDDDNLAHAFKPMRDAIALELGIDDGDPRMRWEYGQIETRGRTGCTVNIERISP